MELQDTHYMSLNVDSFRLSAKVFNHLKSYGKKGLIQIMGSENNPTFQIMTSVEDSGVLFFKVLHPFEVFSVMDGPSDNISISFLNQSFGNVYNHGKEFFRDCVHGASICVKKRPSHENPEFVKTKIVLHDDVSTLSHCTALTSWNIPANEIKQTRTVSKVVLSSKTCTMIQKWLKSFDCSNLQSVRISLNDILSVVVLTVNDDSKTIDFKIMNGNPETDLLFAEKQGDHGMVTDDAVCEVSLKTLVAALGICKIPAYCLPCLNFKEGGMLQIVGLPLKNTKPISCEVSVLLANSNPTVEFNHEPQCEKSVESCLEEETEEVTATCKGDLASIPKTPNPTLPSHLASSTFYLKDLSCSDSEPEPQETPVSIKLKPVTKKPEKRKRESAKKEPKSKVPKLTFNPLI